MESTSKELDLRINAIKGNYVFRSPYHKNKKMLPFNILNRNFSDEFPVSCSTVSYRGWKKENVFAGYKIESLEDKIESGFLIKIN